MKKTLLICGVLLAFAVPAMAQGPYTPGLDLHWNDCALGATAAVNATWGCNNNANGNAVSMTASFVTPGRMTGFLTTLCVIDLQTSAATLSPWWHMESPSTCANRAGRINTSATFLPTTGCTDPWGGSATPGGLYFVPSPGLLTPNSARYKAVAGLQTAQATTIDNLDTTDPLNPVPIVYDALNVNITKPGTLPLAVCPGCNDGACIVLNEIVLTNISTSDPLPLQGDTHMSAVYGFAGAQNWITYKGGAATHGGVCPGDPPTPTHKSTWGSVKALYR